MCLLRLLVESRTNHRPLLKEFANSTATHLIIACRAKELITHKNRENTQLLYPNDP